MTLMTSRQSAFKNVFLIFILCYSLCVTIHLYLNDFKPTFPSLILQKHQTNAQSEVEGHLNCLQLIPHELHFGRVYARKRAKLSGGLKLTEEKEKRLVNHVEKSLSNHVPLRQQ